MKGKTLTGILAGTALASVALFTAGRMFGYSEGRSDEKEKSQAAIEQLIEVYGQALPLNEDPDEIFANSLFRTHIYFTREGQLERSRYGILQSRHLLESLSLEGAGDMALGPEYRDRFFVIEEEAQREKMRIYVEDNPSLQPLFDETLRLLDEVKKNGAINSPLAPVSQEQKVY